MSRPVTIVTDSTAALPANLLHRNPIRVLPLTLHWQGEQYADGVDLTPSVFYTRLATAASLPTTSQVSTGVFQSVFDELLAEGRDVLVLPISSGISSTHAAAESALQGCPPERIQIIDTHMTTMGLGFAVLAAARAAASGASLDECAAQAQNAIAHTSVFFTVDTLQYLAAGGRINSAKRLLGAAINIKPVLQLRGGKIELVTSVISRRKALGKMLDLAEQSIDGRAPVRLGVFHALAEPAARELMLTAAHRFRAIETILAELSPVIGAHVGPGTLGIAIQAGAE